jgi:putative FmdB family regulatory protein
MPLYEYACRRCEARFEVLQRMGAGAAGLSCPGCGGSRLARELSTFAAGSSSASEAGVASAAPGPGMGCACNPGRASCP